MNKTVVELRAEAKELGLVGYSKLNKAELVSLIEEARICNMTAQEFVDYIACDESEECAIYDSSVEEVEPVVEQSVTVERVLDAQQVSDFVNRYKTFKLYDNLRDREVYPTQINMAKAIMNNFEVEIAIDSVMTAGEMSDILTSLLNDIEAKRLKARPKSVVAELVKGYKAELKGTPVTPINVVKKASQAQLNYITRLEKETGVPNTKIVDSVKTANEIIQSYLKLKNNKVASEVAVTTPECFGQYDRFNDSSFRTKFVAMMKRIFA